jgi:uncharacterized membrane protein YeaQ/YmgE (transglycosylase-associated protein family)
LSSWMLCGLIVGVITLLLSGRRSMGLLLTLGLCVGGAVVGGLSYALIQGAPSEPFSVSGDAWHGWVVATLGALLVLWVYAAIGRKSSWQ